MLCCLETPSGIFVWWALHWKLSQGLWEVKQVLLERWWLLFNRQLETVMKTENQLKQKLRVVRVRISSWFYSFCVILLSPWCKQWLRTFPVLVGNLLGRTKCTKENMLLSDYWQYPYSLLPDYVNQRQFWKLIVVVFPRWAINVCCAFSSALIQVSQNTSQL